jgi:hypothetical protein
MGASKSFGQEILVIGVLSADAGIEEAVLAALESAFGAVESVSAREVFTWTDYYNAEMGGALFRYYLEFKDLVDPSDLAIIKLRTNALEVQFASDGRRRVNLDPGLLAPGRFVLATTKDRAHRIALSDGIYAELTLIYEKREFHPLPWTYPDWASEPVRAMLARERKRLFLRKN